VSRGVILDVIVDIRPASPTFGMWESYVLSASLGEQLWIPPGFAHGFCTQDLATDVMYKVTEYRYPEDECCIRYDDPALKINWETSSHWKMKVSDKDLCGMSWDEFKKLP
jgi:dTDP-4-dehydrorhamnose 3,5-epimerase